MWQTFHADSEKLQYKLPELEVIPSSHKVMGFTNVINQLDEARVSILLSVITWRSITTLEPQVAFESLQSEKKRGHLISMLNEPRSKTHVISQYR